MSHVTDKLDLLLNSVEKCQPNIADLKPGLTRSAIANKTANLPFKFPEEIYQLYMWHDGIGEEDYGYFDVDSEATTPMIFRDHYLLNLDDAVQTYSDVREYLNPDDYKIVDWNMCFPFASLDGSYYFFVCGNHVLANRYKHPIIELYHGLNMMFHSFDSMLDTLIECYQQTDRQSYEQYGILDRNYQIWAKHNPNIFNEMNLYQYR